MRADRTVVVCSGVCVCVLVLLVTGWPLKMSMPTMKLAKSVPGVRRRVYVLGFLSMVSRHVQAKIPSLPLLTF